MFLCVLYIQCLYSVSVGSTYWTHNSTPFLAQISGAGSTIWLAHWSSSQRTLPTDTTRFTHSTNATERINLTDSGSFTEKAPLRDMNLTDSSTVMHNLTDSAGLTVDQSVDKGIFLVVYGALTVLQCKFGALSVCL